MGILKETSELDDSNWAVATASEVLAQHLTYNQAIGFVNRNLDKDGLCIITQQAAETQIELQREKEAKIAKHSGRNNGASRTAQ